jgi:hypothetical protein
MAVKAPALIALLASLGLGALAMLMAWNRPPQGAGGGYVLLLVDEAQDDRALEAALTRAGVEGAISESTQWVYWDDFGELRSIPLDEFSQAAEAFDPRHDGYAETLRGFFVREGERRLYIPLSPGPEAARRLQARVARALGDIPFTLKVLSLQGAPLLGAPSSGPFPWEWLLFLLAAGGALALSGVFPQALALVPLTAALALAGPAGFALSGILFALFGILRSPLRELFAFRRYRFPGAGLRGRGIQMRVFKFSWLVSLLFLAAYGFICIWGNIPLVLGGLALGCFCGVTALVHWAESGRGRGQGHIRFMPVPLGRPSLNPALFPRTMLPFFLASLAALALPLVFPGLSAGEVPAYGEEEPFLLDEGAYLDHLAFQASFSLRPLGESRSGEPVYARYVLGEDGLIAESRAGDAVVGSGGEDAWPPFPLGDLMAFLGGYRPNEAPPAGRDRVTVLVILILAVPSLVPSGGRPWKKGRFLIYHDKRVAA